jgi:aspartyl-tRNA(Asn)/glutamyl-tRNA(Gln) amidotransferase subunit C
MPKLNLEEVEHIAELARLGLSDAEKEMFREQLSSILDYAEMLKQINTSGVVPTTSALPLENVMRPDEAADSLSVEDVLANSPDATSDQFRVRSILE